METLPRQIILLLSALRASDGFLLNGNSTLEDRLTKVEAELVQMRNELAMMEGCTSDICEIHWGLWSSWAPWSSCSGQCSSNQGNRPHEQTRSRQRTCLTQSPELQGVHCSGSATETESRPCNAVELYGCINTNDQGPLNGLVYNFFDELAQSVCTAAVKSGAHVLAIRRNCNTGQAPQCSTICANHNYTCFDELHVYDPYSVLHPDKGRDEGKPGLMMFRYFSCSFVNGGCGPNYCCCQF